MRDFHRRRYLVEFTDHATYEMELDARDECEAFELATDFHGVSTAVESKAEISFRQFQAVRTTRERPA